MKIPKKLLKYLKEKNLAHEILQHKTVYTAYDAAQTLKTRLEEIVKPLLVKVDRRYMVVAIPAHYSLDLPKLKKAVKAKRVELAKEGMMKQVLKVTPGAMTAFGSIHGLEVVVDKNLSKLSKAVFSAGSFTESLRLKLKDFIKAEQPLIALIGKKKSLPKPKLKREIKPNKILTARKSKKKKATRKSRPATRR